MREHSWPEDDCPEIYHDLIQPADIVVLATPVWLGDQSSVTRLTIEMPYGWSGVLNDAGQWAYYGKVGGAPVTWNMLHAAPLRDAGGVPAFGNIATDWNLDDSDHPNPEYR